MNNLNSVLIEGNMVRDPLIRSTPKGTPVCNFLIASNRYFRQDSNLEKEVGFFDVEAWGKLADACNSQGRKGRGVRVVGRLKQDRWTGNDGKNHAKISIVAEHVEYRADFKKAEPSTSEVESIVDASALESEHEKNLDQSDFFKPPKKCFEVEELQAASF